MILDKFPDIKTFYKHYWGRKPFVVRGAIQAEVFESLIDGDELAGLALEEEIKSRIVTTASDGESWSCAHGPFEENAFSLLGEKNWSLLVQNVDHYHPPTAALLEEFAFSPRWLLDDIMVSYSAPGGTVGPHLDSYHVFLVQGEGKRRWKLASKANTAPDWQENMELKVLKETFEGEAFEVEKGDVIYIPPQFAHEGITLEPAMTFSIGFLGPQMSELLSEYSFYLEEQETQNKRYLGAGLDAHSTGEVIDELAIDTLRANLIESIKSDSFANWLKEYFSSKDEPLYEA